MLVAKSIRQIRIDKAAYRQIRHFSLACPSTADGVPQEGLDFVPRSIFERLQASLHEIDPSCYDERQVQLTTRESDVGTRWKLLQATTDSHPTTGYFSPNEWIQLLTHPSYFHGIAVNNSKFAVLGEPLVDFLVCSNDQHFTNCTLPTKQDDNQTSSAPSISQSFRFLNRTGHLGSSIHIAHRMRYMGITDIIRCHREERTIVEPSLKIIQSVFHAIVGGIYQKAGMEASSAFVKQTLTFHMPRQSE